MHMWDAGMQSGGGNKGVLRQVYLWRAIVSSNIRQG